jgi:hypothetical protein
MATDFSWRAVTRVVGSLATVARSPIVQPSNHFEFSSQMRLIDATLLECDARLPRSAEPEHLDGPTTLLFTNYFGFGIFRPEQKVPAF